jgi:hypothetical protein
LTYIYSTNTHWAIYQKERFSMAGEGEQREIYALNTWGLLYKGINNIYTIQGNYLLSYSSPGIDRSDPWGDLEGGCYRA